MHVFYLVNLSRPTQENVKIRYDDNKLTSYFSRAFQLPEELIGYFTPVSAIKDKGALSTDLLVTGYKGHYLDRPVQLIIIPGQGVAQRPPVIPPSRLFSLP